MRAVFAGALVALASTGAAHAAGPATHCAAGERVVYNCAFGHKVGSICLAPSSVSYRYGPLGKPELEITSNGKDGHAFQDNIMGSGGSSETAVRFVNNGYSYVIYVETRGALTDHPNENNSALIVFKNPQDDGTTLACKHLSNSYLNLELPAFVPKEVEDSDFDHYY